MGPPPALTLFSGGYAVWFIPYGVRSEIGLLSEGGVLFLEGFKLLKKFINFILVVNKLKDKYLTFLN